MPGTQTLFGKWTVAKFAERPRETHDGKPPEETAYEKDYTPARIRWRHGGTSPARSVNARKRPCLHWREGNCSARVTVPSGLLANLHGPSQVGENGLEIGDDGLDALGFRFHAQQCLLEIEVERE